MERISINQLRQEAKEVEETLNREGCTVKVQPLFAYGMYSYYFEFKNRNYENTHYGTKRETISKLHEIGYYVLSHKENYQ